MKILSAAQIRELDKYTIDNMPISSLDLMENAAQSFVNWFKNIYPISKKTIHIFCGPGNNGGDGLAIARLLHHLGYDISLYLCKISSNVSIDYQNNLDRLPRHGAIKKYDIQQDSPLPLLPKGDLIIDGIFGSGLNRPVSGYWQTLIQHLNQQPCICIAIDIPSGLFADQHTKGVVIQAHHTFSFQIPKLAFLFPSNFKYVGEWTTGDIGLMSTGMANMDSTNYYITKEIVKSIYRPRKKYDHKGTFGHGLLIAGSYGMYGAALLTAKASLKSGLGLVTVHLPKSGNNILQSTVPEAIVSLDKNEFK